MRGALAARSGRSRPVKPTDFPTVLGRSPTLLSASPTALDALDSGPMQDSAKARVTSVARAILGTTVVGSWHR